MRSVVKIMKLIRINLLFLLAILFAVPIMAQDEPVAEPQRSAVANQDPRANMLRQLGLNRDQIQQVQRVNRVRKPLMDAAQAKLRAANQALDTAIYADEVNETDIQARLKEVQLAQAEVFRIRFTSELAIRRLLTPEQLVRFRNMRQRFERAREEAEQRQTMSRENIPRNVNTTKDTPTPLKSNIKPDDM